MRQFTNLSVAIRNPDVTNDNRTVTYTYATDDPHLPGEALAAAIIDTRQSDACGPNDRVVSAAILSQWAVA